jgi:hypothetical protein
MRGRSYIEESIFEEISVIYHPEAAWLSKYLINIVKARGG